MLCLPIIHRCLFTGDAVGSGYVVGVRYEKNRFHETYAWYRDNLERFIGRMKGKEDYTCFGGHFIQENSCMDEMQEDYLNNQSEYFVPFHGRSLKICMCWLGSLQTACMTRKRIWTLARSFLHDMAVPCLQAAGFRENPDPVTALLFIENFRGQNHWRAGGLIEIVTAQ